MPIFLPGDIDKKCMGQLYKTDKSHFVNCFFYVVHVTTKIGSVHGMTHFTTVTWDIQLHMQQHVNLACICDIKMTAKAKGFSQQ